ncbi:MAG: outer membrane beta-barrel protein, partial [Flavicella sp.]|nr:outer membrane beta-barrel protein [Flavicella sp.]
NVTLTLGQFNTFYGYEVISPAANFNYSVSYLFNAGPFSHTGLKIDIAASDDLSYMLAITNPMGLMEGSNSSSDDYQLGAQVGYKGHYLNAAYGADAIGYDMTKYNSPDEGLEGWTKFTKEAIFVKDVLYLDYTGGFDLSESLYLGINAAYANSNDANYGYQGAALYLQKTVSDTFSLGLRPEFFQTTGSYTIEGSVPSEDDPATLIDEETSISNETSVFALTLAGSTQLSDNLKLITEVRYDSSDDMDLVGGKDTVTGLTIAAVYSF